MAAGHWSLVGVKLGAAVLGGTTSGDFEDNFNIELPDIDGESAQSLALVLESMPVLRFTSKFVEEVIDALGLSGTSIATLTGGVVLYFAKHDVVGKVSGTNHVSLTALAGVAVVESLTANQGATADVVVRVHPVAAGGANPVTIALNATLPETAAASAVYTLGPVYLDGSATDGGERGVTLSWNPDVQSSGSGGSVYPTVVALHKLAPTIEVRTEDVNFAASLGTSNNGVRTQGGTETRFFLRGVTNNSLVVAGDATSNIRFDVGAGVFTRAGISGGRRAEATYRAQVTADGDGLLVQYTKGVAVAGAA